MLAYLHLETGRLDRSFYERKWMNEFLGFLKRVRWRCRTSDTLYVAPDNYSPHVSSSVLECPEENDVIFYCTPTNARWLNRIERCFTAMSKSFFCGVLLPGAIRSCRRQSRLTWRGVTERAQLHVGTAGVRADPKDPVTTPAWRSRRHTR